MDAREPPHDDFPPRRPFGVPAPPQTIEPDEETDRTPPRRSPGGGGPQRPATPS